MRVYVRTYRRKRPPHPSLRGFPCGVSQYFYIYTPAKESVDGRSHLKYVSRGDPIMMLAGVLQRSERRRGRQQRERLRELQEQVQGGKPGRPRKHMGREILEYLGAYRRGDRVVLGKKMPPDERARRRYTLLSAEWRELLTVEEFINLDVTRIVSMRKSANRLGKAWDPNGPPLRIPSSTSWGRSYLATVAR